MRKEKEAHTLRCTTFREDPPPFPKKLESHSANEPDFKKAKDREKAFRKLNRKFDELSEFAQELHISLVNDWELAEDYITLAQPDLVKKQREITANSIKMTELCKTLEGNLKLEEQEGWHWWSTSWGYQTAEADSLWFLEDGRCSLRKTPLHIRIPRGRGLTRTGKSKAIHIHFINILMLTLLFSLSTQLKSTQNLCSLHHSKLLHYLRQG